MSNYELIEFVNDEFINYNANLQANVIIEERNFFMHERHLKYSITGDRAAIQRLYYVLNFLINHV